MTIKETTMFKYTLSVVLSLMTVASMISAAPLKLASGGKALVKIAVTAKQNQFDKFAAADLASYLGRMAGAEFAIVNESELAKNEAAIYVGRTAKAEALGLTEDKFEREEWCIKSPDDKSIVITGGSPIGAFYGSWALLSHFGCYAVTWDQDAIPNLPELTYDGFEEQRKPVFGGRMIYDGQTSKVRGTNPANLEKYYMWILRNYVNGRQDNSPVPFYTSGVFNICQPQQYHSMECFLPAEKYFKEHPEYYWMTESGQRLPPPRKGYTGGLCLTNPDVVRLVTENLLEMIKADRASRPKDEWSTVYDISRLDGALYFCKCPECKKIEEAESSQQSLLYHFLNAISDAVVKQYPDVIIRTFAPKEPNYNPNRTMPRDNILLWVADNYQKSDCFRPLSHPINDESRKILVDCVKDGKRFMVWDYWNLGGAQYFLPPRVETIFDALQPDLRFFRDIGATDMFIEASMDKAAPQNFMNLHYFIANQLMVNPDQDVERLADIFISAYYGPNAELIRNWFNQIRKGVAAEPRRQPSLGAVRWSFCTNEYMISTYKMLKNAAAKLPEGDVYRKRIEYEMLPVILSIIPDWRLYEKDFEELAMTKRALYDEAVKYAFNFVSLYGGSEATRKVRFAAAFNDVFGKFAEQPIPEKFKGVPADKIAIIGYSAFTVKRSYWSTVVDDRDAICGKAFCNANPEERRHGLGKVMSTHSKRAYKTTEFEAAGAKFTIEEAQPDEKYHWYKMDGKANISNGKVCFWGQAWIIEARLLPIYDPVEPKNNLWDEVWFRAKLTGPAYFEGSKQKNGIYIDQVVFIRK